MLTKLATLTKTADGRYANPQELQFLKDYLGCASVRLSAYEKLCAAEDEIIKQVELTIKSTYPGLFVRNSQDCSPICKRDIKCTLSRLSAAILIDDLDHLKNDLLWQSKVMRAFQNQYAAKITYPIVSQVITQMLTKEEADLVKSALQLVEAFLQ